MQNSDLLLLLFSKCKIAFKRCKKEDILQQPAKMQDHSLSPHHNMIKNVLVWTNLSVHSCWVLFALHINGFCCAIFSGLVDELSGGLAVFLVLLSLPCFPCFANVCLKEEMTEEHKVAEVHEGTPNNVVNMGVALALLHPGED